MDSKTAIEKLELAFQWFKEAKSRIRNDSFNGGVLIVDLSNDWLDIKSEAHKLSDYIAEGYDNYVPEDCLENDLNGYTDYGCNLQKFYIKQINDDFSKHKSFIVLQAWLKGGAKIESSNVLYTMNFNNPANVKETRADDICNMLNDMIYDCKKNIRAWKKQSIKVN